MKFDEVVARSVVCIAGILILFVVTGFFSLHIGIYPEGYSKIDIIQMIVFGGVYQPLAYLTLKNWEKYQEVKE